MVKSSDLATRIFVRRRAPQIFGGISPGGGTVTEVDTAAPITGGPITTTGTIGVNAATSSTLGVVQPDNTTITISAGVISAVTSGVPNFVDNETVSGSGTSWTLAHTPVATPLLVVMLPSFGGVVLILSQTPGFTISGTSITTTSSYSSGALRAWYRY